MRATRASCTEQHAWRNTRGLVSGLYLISGLLTTRIPMSTMTPYVHVYGLQSADCASGCGLHPAAGLLLATAIKL